MNKDAFKSFCAENLLVCPMPPQWVKFDEMLTMSTNKTPPHSLILSYWFESSDSDKMTRVQQQIDWAEANGVLSIAIDYLGHLNPKQWHKRAKGSL